MLLADRVVSAALVLTVELVALEGHLRAKVGPVLIRAASHLVVRVGELAVERCLKLSILRHYHRHFLGRFTRVQALEVGRTVLELMASCLELFVVAEKAALQEVFLLFQGI